MLRPIRRAALLGCAFALLTGCFSTEPPLRIRYFRPATVASGIQPIDDAPAVRLMPIDAARELGVEMLWTTSPVEVGFDEANQWAAPPSDLVRAALVRTLHGPAGIPPLEHGEPAVTIYLDRFGGDQPAGTAVVRWHATLRDVNGIVRQRTFDATTPLSDDSPASLATAIGTSLQRAADRTAAWIGGGDAR